MFEELHEITNVFLEDALRVYVLHAGFEQKAPFIISTDTIVSTNVGDFGHRTYKYQIYGFGTQSGVRYILSPAILRLIDLFHPELACTGEALSIIHDLSVNFIERLLSASAKTVVRKTNWVNVMTNHVNG